jgi:hypothetical protein
MDVQEERCWPVEPEPAVLFRNIHGYVLLVTHTQQILSMHLYHLQQARTLGPTRLMSAVLMARHNISP